MNPIIIQRMRALLILRYYIEIYKLLLLVYHSLEKCIGAVSDIVKYSPFNQRISKTVNGNTEYYVYERPKLGGDVITDYDNSLNVNKKYILHPNKIDDPIIQKKENKNFYYQKDEHGSVTSILDDTATIKNTYKYYAFGGSKSKTETIENSYQYTSREKEKENKLYCYRSRMYNPLIGRFIQKDKIRYGIDWYIYVNNSPINNIDPYGYLTASEKRNKCHQDVIDWTVDELNSADSDYDDCLDHLARDHNCNDCGDQCSDFDDLEMNGDPEDAASVENSCSEQIRLRLKWIGEEADRKHDQCDENNYSDDPVPIA